MVKTLNKQVTETFLYQPCPPEPGAVSVALAYPADHNIAMSSIGYLNLFRQLDENPAVAVTRLSVDRLSAFKGQGFELLGFSFSFELDILNILKTQITF